MNGTLSSKAIEVQLKPHKSLISKVQEIVSFNDFSPNDYDSLGLGYFHF